MLSCRYYFHILINREFSVPILEKYWNIKIYENPSSESRDVPCGQADGQA
jgi:hypothetical protein